MSKLWYDRPAAIWNEALPLGNGNLGAMVYGGIDYELIKLNHDTLWSGTVRPEPQEFGKKFHDTVRRMIFEGKYAEADEYIQKNTKTDGCCTYLPMGDIDIRFDKTQKTDGYRRELDLETATLTVESASLDTSALCANDGKKAKKNVRTYFASYPHGVILCRMTSADPTGMTFCLRADSTLRHSVEETENGLFVTGRAPRAPYIYDSEDTVRFGYAVSCFADKKVAVENGRCFIQDAHDVTIVIAAETDFVAYDKTPDKQKDLKAACLARITHAMADGYDEVYRAHVDDYRSLYDRVSLTFDEDTRAHIPTDRRIAEFGTDTPDTALIGTLFDYGRYLTIASSRRGTQPTNLQGIWNGNRVPAWKSNYTVNINTQMNYWHVEACGLGECHEPLFDMLRELSVAGEKTANNLYGCRGFALNHSTDIWRKTTPCGGMTQYSYWPASGGWLCSHLYTHFKYTEDMDFLRDTAFPITEKSARFYLDFLVKAPDGTYVTAPATSPENAFLYDGHRVSADYGTTMDMSIIRGLLLHLIEMADRLGMETEIVKEAREMLPKLRMPEIQKDGRLCEWHTEFGEPEPGHRHLSHLYGVFPGDTITEKNTALYEAARKSLLTRIENGSGYTGWSGAWILNLLAVYGDRKRIWDRLVKFFEIALYPNMFDSHPPFQIDGNFGIVAAICNMLAQEKNGELLLLPAMPRELPNGEIRDLRISGQRTLSFRWKNGLVIEDSVIIRPCGKDR